jgi:CheY-like chemotaxis protein
MNVKREPSKPIQVSADRVRFKQVLLNLISNAIKYNVVGGSVEISHAIMPNNVLRIEIRDTGIGISASDQTNIFRPFSRFGDLQHKVEGTGIGLVISKQLIDMMGGQIGFKSKVNEGSEFWIEIPLYAMDKSPDEFKVDRTEGEKWTPEHHDITLLYVEDNAANIRLVSRLVSLVGQAKLISAPTAILGLELAAAHKPDLILMDLQMPGLDGFQALKQLQENPGTCRIPVVAISANVMEGTMQKSKQAGFVDYIAKPINIHKFFEVIEKVVQANNK